MRLAFQLPVSRHLKLHLRARADALGLDLPEYVLHALKRDLIESQHGLGGCTALRKWCERIFAFAKGKGWCGGEEGCGRGRGRGCWTVAGWLTDTARANRRGSSSWRRKRGFQGLKGTLMKFVPGEGGYFTFAEGAGEGGAGSQVRMGVFRGGECVEVVVQVLDVSMGGEDAPEVRASGTARALKTGEEIALTASERQFAERKYLIPNRLKERPPGKRKKNRAAKKPFRVRRTSGMANQKGS